MSHTPGPWKAFKTGVYSETLCIANRHPDEQGEWSDNARLIAAAPDLLEAATMLLGLLNDNDVRTFIARVDGLENLHSAIGAGRVAIAKAIGGT